MKKIIVYLIFLSVVLMINGCSSTVTDLSEMEIGYFNCVSKINREGNITPEEIKKILYKNNDSNQYKEYTLDGDLSVTYPTIIYRLSNKEGILNFEYVKNTGLLAKVTYEADPINIQDISKKLTCTLSDFGNEEKAKIDTSLNLMIESFFYSLSDQLRVNQLVLESTTKKSDLYKAYLDICKKIDKDNNISISYLQDLLPDIEVSNYGNSKYLFKSENDSLSIYNNTVQYSTPKVNLYYSSNGQNKIIIKPETVNEQEELFKIIY